MAAFFFKTITRDWRATLLRGFYRNCKIITAEIYHLCHSLLIRSKSPVLPTLNRGVGGRGNYTGCDHGGHLNIITWGRILSTTHLKQYFNKCQWNPKQTVYQTQRPLINILVGIYNYKISNRRIPRYFKDLKRTCWNTLLTMQTLAEYTALLWPWAVFSSGITCASWIQPVHNI